MNDGQTLTVNISLQAGGGTDPGDDPGSGGGSGGGGGGGGGGAVATTTTTVPTIGTIVGVVRDLETEKLLSGVSITSECGNAVTGSAGKFTLECLSGSYTGTAALDGYEPAEFSFEISSSAVTDIYEVKLKKSPPAPGTSTTTSISDDGSTTTTSVRGLGICLFRQMLGEGKALETIRRFRDSRLSGSPQGLSLVYMYYKHADEITQILEAKPGLKARAAEITTRMLPLVESGVNAGGEITLSGSDYRKITGLLSDLRKEASPGLRKALFLILKRIESGELLKQINVELN